VSIRRRLIVVVTYEPRQRSAPESNEAFGGRCALDALSSPRKFREFQPVLGLTAPRSANRFPTDPVRAESAEDRPSQRAWCPPRAEPEGKSQPWLEQTTPAGSQAAGIVAFVGNSNRSVARAGTDVRDASVGEREAQESRFANTTLRNKTGSYFAERHDSRRFRPTGRRQNFDAPGAYPVRRGRRRVRRET
jgi:hypothetical protein